MSVSTLKARTGRGFLVLFRSLAENCLYGTVPAQLSAMSALVNLTASFANNSLSGAVPAGVQSVFPLSSGVWTGNCLQGISSPYPYCGMVELGALIDLFQMTNTGYWGSELNWLTQAHPCTWYGVTCDASSSVVRYGKTSPCAA